jgi:hypothetical protein
MMKKKIILALLLTALIAGGAFAQQFSMSAGGGGLFDFSGSNGLKATEGDDAYFGHRLTSLGAFVFFDATYAEIDAYFAYGFLSEVFVPALEKVKDAPTSRTTAMQFGFSLLGKYPIDMGNFTIFPLVGVDYNILLSGTTVIKYKDGKKEKEPLEKVEDFSQFGFLAGLGGDIKLNGPLFIRLEGLLHIRLPANIYKNEVEDGVKATWGFGPKIKIALGYSF